MGMLGKAKDLLAQDADKVEMAIDNAGEFVDDTTQGNYTDTIHTVTEQAKKFTESADSAAAGEDQQN